MSFFKDSKLGIHAGVEILPVIPMCIKRYLLLSGSTEPLLRLESFERTKHRSFPFRRTSLTKKLPDNDSRSSIERKLFLSCVAEVIFRCNTDDADINGDNSSRNCCTSGNSGIVRIAKHTQGLRTQRAVPADRPVAMGRAGKIF